MTQHPTTTMLIAAERLRDLKRLAARPEPPSRPAPSRRRRLRRALPLPRTV
jgi:hypothetical protein